ncbi:MAG: alkaline phosphatase [Sandaracinaceae bacterium]
MAHDDDAESPKLPSRRTFLSTTAVATAGLLVGCDPESGADAGARDAALPGDAGTTEDAGRAADAGDEDAGTPGPLAPPEDTPEATTFGLGVASGDARVDGAVLWTRYDGTASLRLAVWEMDGASYVAERVDVVVSPADGGFVHHAVTGLTAGARYRYAFFEMDGDMRSGRSAVGRFRAALAADASEVLRIGAVSCVRNGRDHATLERAGERDDLDLFLLLGDSTYNDGDRTLAEYRGSWAENMSTAGWRGTRAATSVLATWDDHEVDNNFDPETADLANPKRAFFENLPLSRDTTDPDRIWRSARWGRTVEVFVLDSRGERRPSVDEYLSRAQMDWLKTGLAASPCTFKLIMNSVPIADFPFPSGGDRWEGYAAQRTEILTFIDDTPIDGVLWVSGDFHLACIGAVARSGPGASQTEILAGPGAQIGNPGSFLLREPQFSWASITNNYTTMELDPTGPQIRVTWHDGSGDVIHAAEIDF